MQASSTTAAIPVGVVIPVAHAAASQRPLSSSFIHEKQKKRVGCCALQC